MSLNTNQPTWTLPEPLVSDERLKEIDADTMRGELPAYVDYRLVRGLVLDLQRARYALLDLQRQATRPKEM